MAARIRVALRDGLQQQSERPVFHTGELSVVGISSLEAFRNDRAAKLRLQVSGTRFVSLQIPILGCVVDQITRITVCIARANLSV